MYYAEKSLNDHARPKAGSSKSAEISKNRDFSTKNETSQNGSPVYQDHSEHVYGSGNDFYDHPGAPDGPPVPHKDG